jgi:hypothetical protein
MVTDKKLGISATSYNIYFDFYNYVNAVNFKNFITSELTV